MKRGTAHRPKQYPPNWKGSESISAKPPAEEHRRERNKAIGHNPFYEYGLGHNLCVLTGTCTREPKLSGPEAREFCWFRISVQNQDHRSQWLYIPVRARGELAIHAWENVAVGDTIAVVGRIWTGKMFRPYRGTGPSIWRQFIWLEAERLSSTYPVQLDVDQRYVRVRVDLWNRMCQMAPEHGELEVPSNRRRDLAAEWEKHKNWYDQVLTDVEQDDGDDDKNEEQSDEDDERDDGG